MCIPYWKIKACVGLGGACQVPYTRLSLSCPSMKKKRIFQNTPKEARIIIGEKPWNILKKEIDKEIWTKLIKIARRSFIFGIIVGWISSSIVVSFLRWLQ